MKAYQARVRSTKHIISVNNDENYYHQMLFPTTSLGEQQEQNIVAAIRYSFYDDIALKYNLDRRKIGHELQNYSLEILRSLAVFGDHEYIIDELRAKRCGTF